jgi:hypothetical protein
MIRLGWCVIISLVIVAVNFTGASIEAADKRPSRSVLAASATVPLPAVFARGEQLAYTVTLNEIPAGDATIKLRKDRHDGREVYRVTAQARTSEMIDYLYRLRGTADGLFTANGLTPLHFRFAYTDNDRPRELGVRYDPAGQTLLGSVQRKARSKERRVPASGVYDPLTAFYFLRSRNLVPGTPCQIEIFTGKERYRMLAHVVRQEKVQLLSGERAALRLQPMVFSLDEAPQKNRLPAETTLWVTTDAAHTPVKLETLLPIGWVVVELSQ